MNCWHKAAKAQTVVWERHRADQQQGLTWGLIAEGVGVGMEVFDNIPTRRMGLYLGRGMSWKFGVMIGLKKKIGTSRRDGVGDKELSGRTQDWEKGYVRSDHWKELELGGTDCIAAEFLNEIVWLSRSSGPEEVVGIVLCAAVPFRTFSVRESW